MTKYAFVARVLLGLPLMFFGLNHFLRFMEPNDAEFMPDAWELLHYLHFGAQFPAEKAQQFLLGLYASGYLMELVALVEIVAGFAFLSGWFVLLGLAVYAPVMVNIVAYHLFLDPVGGVMAYVMLALYLFLTWFHWPSFHGMLSVKGATRARPS